MYIPAKAKSPRCRQARAGGFTLIEVLVAVVILSIGIVFVLQAFETAIAALRESRETVRGVMLVDLQMADQVRHLAFEGRGGMGEFGTFDAPYSGYQWETRSETQIEHQGPDTIVALERLILRVRHEDADRVFEVSTFVRTRVPAL